MSSNLTLVRAFCACCEGGDFTPVEWAHPDLECVIADGPEPGRWIGRAAKRERTRDWLSAWHDWRAEAEEFREPGGGRVPVLLAFTGRGRGSGLTVGRIPAEVAHLFHVSDGYVWKRVIYFNRANAFVDLGLA